MFAVQNTNILERGRYDCSSSDISLLCEFKMKCPISLRAMFQTPLRIHRLNFERLIFERPNFERPNFERLNFERLNLERPNFERPNFERPNFEREPT